MNSLPSPYDLKILIMLKYICMNTIMQRRKLVHPFNKGTLRTSIAQTPLIKGDSVRYAI